ncbi:MAG: nickel pincer cofactor biosynthesis protein LarB [Thermodesulfobacteriota bacterium]
MNVNELKKLLENIKRGRLSINTALERLRVLPFVELGYATLDTHRSLRQGYPEVIFGEGKSPEQITFIGKKMIGLGENVLITRIDDKKMKKILKTLPKASYNKLARTIFIRTHPVKKIGKGTVLVISAGTSDIPVAEEAVVTAEVMGNNVERLYDVGVAGIHRLLNKKEKVFSAHVLIVVAGMEGALPSVVGGIVSRPVIAVPTSVGYGANLGGFTPLLAMLNSCSAGVTVVNIDNGFGAGFAASLINRK